MYFRKFDSVFCMLKLASGDLDRAHYKTKMAGSET